MVLNHLMISEICFKDDDCGGRHYSAVAEG